MSTYAGPQGGYTQLILYRPFFAAHHTGTINMASNVLYMWLNIVASLHYHCCCRKEINIMSACQYSCLSCLACKAHVPCYVICGLSGCTIFFHIISQMARFAEKKLFNVKCEFRFSLQLLSETFLILRRIQRDAIINVHRSSCKVPANLVKILMELEFSRQSFEKF
jgi:hypothetical protein